MAAHAQQRGGSRRYSAPKHESPSRPKSRSSDAKKRLHAKGLSKLDNAVELDVPIRPEPVVDLHFLDAICKSAESSKHRSPKGSPVLRRGRDQRRGSTEKASKSTSSKKRHAPAATPTVFNDSSGAISSMRMSFSEAPPVLEGAAAPAGASAEYTRSATFSASPERTMRLLGLSSNSITSMLPTRLDFERQASSDAVYVAKPKPGIPAPTASGSGQGSARGRTRERGTYHADGSSGANPPPVPVVPTAPTAPEGVSQTLPPPPPPPAQDEADAVGERRRRSSCSSGNKVMRTRTGSSTSSVHGLQGKKRSLFERTERNAAAPRPRAATSSPSVRPFVPPLRVDAIRPVRTAQIAVAMLEPSPEAPSPVKAKPAVSRLHTRSAKQPSAVMVQRQTTYPLAAKHRVSQSAPAVARREVPVAAGRRTMGASRSPNQVPRRTVARPAATKSRTPELPPRQVAVGAGADARQRAVSAAQPQPAAQAPKREVSHAAASPQRRALALQDGLGAMTLSNLSLSQAPTEAQDAAAGAPDKEAVKEMSPAKDAPAKPLRKRPIPHSASAHTAAVAKRRSATMVAPTPSPAAGAMGAKRRVSASAEKVARRAVVGASPQGRSGAHVRPSVSPEARRLRTAGATVATKQQPQQQSSASATFAPRPPRAASMGNAAVAGEESARSSSASLPSATLLNTTKSTESDGADTDGGVAAGPARGSRRVLSPPGGPLTVDVRNAEAVAARADLAAPAPSPTRGVLRVRSVAGTEVSSAGRSSRVPSSTASSPRKNDLFVFTPKRKSWEGGDLREGFFVPRRRSVEEVALAAFHAREARRASMESADTDPVRDRSESPAGVASTPSPKPPVHQQHAVPRRLSTPHTAVLDAGRKADWFAEAEAVPFSLEGGGVDKPPRASSGAGTEPATSPPPARGADGEQKGPKPAAAVVAAAGPVEISPERRRRASVTIEEPPSREEARRAASPTQVEAADAPPRPRGRESPPPGARPARPRNAARTYMDDVGGRQSPSPPPEAKPASQKTVLDLKREKEAQVAAAAVAVEQQKDEAQVALATEASPAAATVPQARGEDSGDTAENEAAAPATGAAKDATATPNWAANLPKSVADAVLRNDSARTRTASAPTSQQPTPQSRPLTRPSDMVWGKWKAPAQLPQAHAGGAAATGARSGTAAAPRRPVALGAPQAAPPNGDAPVKPAVPGSAPESTADGTVDSVPSCGRLQNSGRHSSTRSRTSSTCAPRSAPAVGHDALVRSVTANPEMLPPSVAGVGSSAGAFVPLRHSSSMRKGARTSPKGSERSDGMVEPQSAAAAAAALRRWTNLDDARRQRRAQRDALCTPTGFLKLERLESSKPWKNEHRSADERTKIQKEMVDLQKVLKDPRKARSGASSPDLYRMR